MKQSLIIYVGLVFLAGTSWGFPPQQPIKNTKTPFTGGEELIYRLHYGFINGGKAIISVDDKKLYGQKVFHGRAQGYTTGLTKALFPVNDIYESYFDTKTGLPYKAIRDISEGGYKFYNEVTFSHEDTCVYSQKSGKQEVPAGTLDMVSSLFYLRTINIDTLTKGDVVNFITYFADEIFPFHLRYKGKEIVKTDFGKVRCHRFDPVVEPGRIFKSEDDMSFWLTDDENRVPVLIQFDLIVGSVKCELVQYKNVNSPIKWD